MSQTTYSFKCGSTVAPGDRLSHPEYPGSVVVEVCHKGAITFTVEPVGEAPFGGSCMDAGRYTLNEFIDGRLRSYTGEPDQWWE
jgi:hypothetical protein